MPSRRCVFLSCASLEGYVHDDALAAAPFRERGWEVETVAWDSGADWSAFDAAVIRTAWDYHERVPEFLAALGAIDRAGVPLWNPRSLVTWNATKTYLLDLAARGAPVVPTIHSAGPATHRTSVERAFRELPGAGEHGLVAKPVHGATSSGIARVRAAADGTIDARPEGLLLQPFQPSIQIEGEASLIYFDGRFSHALRKIPRPGEFRSQEEFGSEIRPERPAPDLRAAAERALACLPEVPLYARIDLVRGRGGEPLLMELELIEPALYFRADAGAAERFAEAFAARF